MRRLLLAVFPLALILSLYGCSEDVHTMPDVTGKKLDVAYKILAAAGLSDEDKIEVKGGGIFGVVVESNWTVCKQSVAASKPLPTKVKLNVDRSCKEKGDEASEDANPTASSTPVPVTDITVDALLDGLNAMDASGIKVGDRFKLTGTLVAEDQWGVGATDEYNVLLSAKGGKNDLMVFVKKSDAEQWQNGTVVEMVVENQERSIDGDKSPGWLKAISVKTISGGTTKEAKAAAAAKAEKAKSAAAERALFRDLAVFASTMNKSLGQKVIDSIDADGPDGIDVYLSDAMGGMTLDQARTSIKAWNQAIMDMVDESGTNHSEIQYYFGLQLVAENQPVWDPWSVKFKGALDE